MGARVVFSAASSPELVARARVLRAKGAKRRRALGWAFKGGLGGGWREWRRFYVDSHSQVNRWLVNLVYR